MKLIPLRAGNPFKSADVIKAVASQPTPGQGINADEMRRRCRILDAVDAAANDTSPLEDADYGLLVKLINGFQFATAHPLLVRIIDDVVQPKEPEAAMATTE